jgi:dihydrolipoamide dehydrogenase
MASREVDVVVIGAGPAGEVASGRLAEAGLGVVLVESELVGGECAYWACMPSKALLRPAEALDEVRRVGGAREALGQRAPDAAAALARRDEVIHDLDDSGQVPWLVERGVELVRGEARLVGERRVQVGEEELQARRAVVVATGSGSSMPPIPGLAEASPWTSREGTTAGAVPASLLVLGGGVVGVELAQAWASLGASVTLLEALPALLAREEPFAGEQVADALRARGVDVRLEVKAERVERHAGRVTVALADGEEVEGEEILVAVGRRPRTGDLGLESVGLEPGATLEVGDTMRVGERTWLYAVGDVNGRAPLTHAGKYQAWVASEQILGRPARATHDGPVSPRVVFTDPQVAAVGHTLKSAEEAGLRVRAVDHAVGAVAGASFVGRGAPGTARVILDEDRGVLVGATFTGPEIAELLHSATVAVVGEVPVATLRHAIPSFPTRSEVWLRLQDKLEPVA